MASTRKGSWVYQRVAPDQPHDADLGATGIGRDLNHVGDQQDCPDGLHQGDGEGRVGQAVQDSEQPVDQFLLVEHMVYPGLP